MLLTDPSLAFVMNNRYFSLSCGAMKSMYKLLKGSVENVATQFCFKNNQLKMISGDMLPIIVVQWKGFRKPDYTVPWHQTITVRLEKMYSEAAGSLREIPSLVEKVAITNDAWTALTTESYVTVTFTFLLTGLCRVRNPECNTFCQFCSMLCDILFKIISINFLLKNAISVCSWARHLKHDGRGAVLKESADPLSSATQG